MYLLGDWDPKIVLEPLSNGKSNEDLATQVSVVKGKRRSPYPFLSPLNPLRQLF